MISHLGRAKGNQRAPESEQHPDLEKIADDPIVAAAIDEAWRKSNPDGNIGGPKQEKGFWVVKNMKNGKLSVFQFPDNGTNDSLTPGPIPNNLEQRVVAFFHTHPNTSEEGYVSEPSDADKAFASAANVRGIIKSHDGMYYF